MRVVIFTLTNTKILTNPVNIDQFKTWTNAVIDPDLSLVQGYPPHFWKLVDGQILPMTKEEQAYRMELIAAGKMDNVITPAKLKYKKSYKNIQTACLVLSILNLIMLGYIIWR